MLNKKIDNKIREADKVKKHVAWQARQSNKYMDQEQEGYIIPDEGEETNKMPQNFISKHLPKYISDNIFDLKLRSGPFHVDFSENGNSLLLSGRKSASIIEWKSKDMKSELELEDTDKITDAKFINGDRMYALSQRERLMIYDNQGLELHSLDAFPSPRYLENLPYHFLLVCSLKNK